MSYYLLYSYVSQATERIERQSDRESEGEEVCKLQQDIQGIVLCMLVCIQDEHAINCVPKQEIKPVRHLLDPNPNKRKSQVLSVNMRKTFHNNKSEKKDGKNGRMKGSSFRIKNTPKMVEKIDREIKQEVA